MKIVVASGKGGTGKTVVAANIARILSSENKKVLLIDLDIQTRGLTYLMFPETTKIKEAKFIGSAREGSRGQIGYRSGVGILETTEIIYGGRRSEVVHFQAMGADEEPLPLVQVYDRQILGDGPARYNDYNENNTPGKISFLFHHDCPHNLGVFFRKIGFLYSPWFTQGLGT